jgi:hypothetical protein
MKYEAHKYQAKGIFLIQFWCQPKTKQENPMTNIAQVSTALQNVLGSQADAMAREKKFVRRKVKVSGSNFAQTLVFGFLDNPKMSYREMKQAAGLSNLEIIPYTVTNCAF